MSRNMCELEHADLSVVSLPEGWNEPQTWSGSESHNHIYPAVWRGSEAIDAAWIYVSLGDVHAPDENQVSTSW